MLKGHDIVCVGLLSWQNDYTKSTMQLLTELAGNNRVLFINYAHTVKDVWQHIRKRKSIPLAQVTGRADRLVCHQLENGGQVYVLTPPAMLPINQLPAGWLYDRLLAWNTRRILNSTRRAMKRLNFTAPVVINALHPTIGIGLVGRLAEKALIYYCYDAIQAETWSATHGVMAEEQLLRQADAVVTTSRSLFDMKRVTQPNCYLVENGVDISLFQQANIVRSHRTSKTIGYIGSIDNRLDIDLLEQCFRHYAQVRFLLVGRIPDPALAQRLRRFANVELAGPQPPAKLPQLVEQMDMGLIPFCRNEQTKAIYPMKINEYLAAGLPVITTDFTDLRSFGSLITVCSGTDAFLVAIGAALQETDLTLPRQRLALAQQNSWENRGRQFGEALETVLQQRGQLSPSPAIQDCRLMTRAELPATTE